MERVSACLHISSSCYAALLVRDTSLWDLSLGGLLQHLWMPTGLESHRAALCYWEEEIVTPHYNLTPLSCFYLWFPLIGIVGPTSLTWIPFSHSPSLQGLRLEQAAVLWLFVLWLSGLTRGRLYSCASNPYPATADRSPWLSNSSWFVTLACWGLPMDPFASISVNPLCPSLHSVSVGSARAGIALSSWSSWCFKTARSGWLWSQDAVTVLKFTRA